MPPQGPTSKFNMSIIGFDGIPPSVGGATQCLDVVDIERHLAGGPQHLEQMIRLCPISSRTGNLHAFLIDWAP